MADPRQTEANAATAIHAGPALQLRSPAGPHLYFSAVLPTLDVVSGGVIPSRMRHAMIEGNTDLLAAGAYDGELVVGPARGFAMRVHRVQTYVRDFNAVGPTWQAPGFVNLVNAQLHVVEPCPMDTTELVLAEPAGGVAAGFPVVGVSGPAVFNVDALAEQAGVAARMTYEPANGLYLVHGQDVVDGAYARLLSFMWNRVALLNDIDQPVIHLTYTVVPVGLYPP